MSRIRPYSTTLPKCMHCFKCDEYGHIVVDCPHQIPPSGTPAHHHRPEIPYQALYQIDFSPPSPGQVQTQQIKVTVHPHRYHSHSCHDSYRDIPGHIIETIDIIIGVLHRCPHSSTYHSCCDTHTSQIVFTQELINLLSGPEQIHDPFSIQTK